MNELSRKAASAGFLTQNPLAKAALPRGERLIPNPKARLREQVHEVARYRQLSFRTEDSYWQWIRRYILFQGKRHPREMDAPQVRQFLSHLATERKVAPATQSQALNALVFLHREIIGRELGDIGIFDRPERKQRLPVVLSKGITTFLAVTATLGHCDFMIGLIVGTNRPGSNTRKICRLVEEIYAELKVPMDVIDLANLPSEIFSPSAYGNKPNSFKPFSDSVLASDGLVVVTPEYNGSVPGILKYFIDMLKFPESFDQRPVCFVGLAAGMWGALRPVEQLQMIFGYRNAFLFPERVFLPKINDLLNEQGRLKDEELLKRLREQAEGFVQFVERLKAKNLRSMGASGTKN